ncbi:hypothetical protein D3C80_1179120 [compost metagenome]
MAKNPITTDGKAASISIIGFMISFLLLEAKQEVYTAANIARGPAIKMAMMVTFKVPISNASKPKRGLSETGTHSVEKKVLQVLSAPSLFPVTLSSITIS